MSAPASDPPVPPPAGDNNGVPKPESSPVSDEQTPLLADQPTEDVKMEEVKPVEDTLEDVPDHVRNVRLE